MERYQKELRDRQALLLGEVDSFLQGELRGLRLTQENLEVELASISSYCDSTETALNAASEEDSIADTDLVNLRRQCSEYLQQLNDHEANANGQAKQVRFTYEGQGLQSSISSFGELVIGMPGTTSGSVRRNSDGSLNDRETRRRWGDAQPVDSVFLTAATADALLAGENVDNSPRANSSPPVPTIQNRQNRNNRTTAQSSLYTAPGVQNHTSHTRSSWNRNSRTSMSPMSNALSSPWRPPNRRNNRTRDAINAGYMFPMSTSPSLRDELEAIREMELLSGNQEQLALTRQLDNTMARQNRRRNTTNTVASIFGQEPPEWRHSRQSNHTPRQSTQATPIQETARDLTPSRQAAARRRNLDERPAGIAGGAPTGQSNSTPRANNEPLPSDSSFHEVAPSPPTERNQRNTSQSNNANRGSQNRASNRGRARNNRAAVVRRVEESRNGVSFEVSLNSPRETEENNTRPGGGSETYRAADRAENTNTENQDSNQSTEPQAASEDMPPPGPPVRTRTYVNVNEADSPQHNANISRPVVADTAISFDVPLDIDPGNVGLDDDSNMLTFRLSTSDSLTTMRPVNNYQIKGVPVRVLGSGRGSETGKFTFPRGVAVSPLNDTVVVADSSNHRVQIFDVNGQFVTGFGSYGQAPGEMDCISGIAVNSMGQIVLSDRYNNRIQVFDRWL